MSALGMAARRQQRLETLRGAERKLAGWSRSRSRSPRRYARTAFGCSHAKLMQDKHLAKRIENSYNLSKCPERHWTSSKTP